MNAKLEAIRKEVKDLREEHDEKLDQLYYRVTVLKKRIKRLEKPPKKGKEQKKGKTKGKKLPPIEKGGRPRIPDKKEGGQVVPPTRPRRLKPEIICWKRERQWIPAVEVPEEYFEGSILAVLQNGESLTQDDGSREGYRSLKEACGQVVVRWNKDEVVEEHQIALEGNYLLFKLSGQHQNQGRRVKSSSSGSYLVIAPEKWQRDATFSGPPPVTPETVSLIGYQAHFFKLEKGGDERIAFRTPEGKSVVIESKASRFELVGTCLNDVTEGMGPLFGERLPQVRALEDQAWKGVVTVVIGEEGSGQGSWRKPFSPTSEGTQQELPHEVAARKWWWYFLRFYDHNDDLIESLDFRFVRALKEIRIHQPSYLPPENGHRPVRVEFLHDLGCAVQPADGLTSIQIEGEDGQTILTISPDPTYDETRWLVNSEDGTKVEVTILVERLWWAVEDEDKEPSKWEDQPLTLPRDDFAATSEKALWLRIPRRRWVDKVLVGFEQLKARPYDVKVTEKTVCIPIRDFGDAQEIRRVGITPLNLWFYRQGITYTGTPCELIVKVGCRTCDFMASKEEDMFHHVESIHIDEFFRLLTYEEMRDRIPSLPFGIYKCSYCNFYVVSDDYRNPTSTIIRHIEKVHRGGVRFRIISDIDEIRENVISDLQRIHRCKLCSFHLDEATQRDMMQHLMKNHRNRVYALR